MNADHSAALIGAALLYPVLTFGAIVGSVSLAQMGVLSLPIPLFVVGFPLLALTAMVLLHAGQVRFHRSTMIVATIIILGTAWVHLLIFAQAAAAV